MNDTPKIVRKAAPRWTAEEKNQLEAWYRARIPFKEIAAKLGRSITAVTIKANRIVSEANPTITTDPKIVAKVIEGYWKNETLAKIEAGTGVGQGAIRLILRRAGLQRRKRHDVTPKYDPALVAEIKRLYLEEKMKQREISRRLNVPYCTVHCVVKYRGLQNRPEFWTDEECRTMQDMLRSGKDMWTICLRLNKTDLQLICCAKFFDIFDRYPTLHQRLTAEQQRQIHFVLVKFAAIQNYDRKRFGIELKITLEHMFDLYASQEGKCFYTDARLEFQTGHKNTLSIERIDSAKPHVEDNLVLCTWEANLMKQDLDIDRFLMVAETISKRAPAIRVALQKRLSSTKDQVCSQPVEH
ncbi:MAG: hypothetical protein WCV82_03880 [Candidatus Paceibacterota bacterium]|jgi:hypothetical protein